MSRFRDAFVAGYERIRMLPDGWEQACDVYMAARLLAMGSFMLDDASGMDAIPWSRGYLRLLPERLPAWLDDHF